MACWPHLGVTRKIWVSEDQLRPGHTTIPPWCCCNNVLRKPAPGLKILPVWNLDPMGYPHSFQKTNATFSGNIPKFGSTFQQVSPKFMANLLHQNHHSLDTQKDIIINICIWILYSHIYIYIYIYIHSYIYNTYPHIWSPSNSSFPASGIAKWLGIVGAAAGEVERELCWKMRMLPATGQGLFIGSRKNGTSVKHVDVFVWGMYVYIYMYR